MAGEDWVTIPSPAYSTGPGSVRDQPRQLALPVRAAPAQDPLQCVRPVFRLF